MVPNHVVSADVADYPAELRPYADQLRGRSMLVRRLAMVPVECVARGYLTGSGLAEYQRTGAACGVPLPPGLVDGSRLDRPIFTPATKAEMGEHDENVTFEEMAERIGDPELAARLKDLTLAVYTRAREIAERARDHPGRHQVRVRAAARRHPGAGRRGADPGLVPLLARRHWKPGRAQPSYDKQFVRDWLTSPASGWDRAATPRRRRCRPRSSRRPGPRYVEAYETLTGDKFE